jgi:hypothetical protein
MDIFTRGFVEERGSSVGPAEPNTNRGCVLPCSSIEKQGSANPGQWSPSTEPESSGSPIDPQFDCIQH